MRKYLAEKEFSTEEIERLIADFLDYGYLNDLRYCMEYFTYALGKSKGKQRITTELKQKGVDPIIIERAFDEYDSPIDEKQMAYEEAKKIIRNIGVPPGERLSEKVIGRIGRRLSTLGYPIDIVYRTINMVKNNNEEKV